jgi:hypothetical protein
MTKVYWHKYRYLPYERIFGRREVETLLRPRKIVEENDGLALVGRFDEVNLRRLVYFESFRTNGVKVPTFQHLLEQKAYFKIQNRQITRYSVHGIHEYKGKFNPQVVRGILNLLNVPPGAQVLDPFCGSGTTLSECTHIDIPSLGCDINPMAVLISNTKQLVLSTAACKIKKVGEDILDQLSANIRGSRQAMPNTPYQTYLLKWFPEETFYAIENLREIILSADVALSSIFLLLASDLLRDYSLQEPADLRIRRRKSPFPDTSFFDALKRSFYGFFNKIESTQELIGIKRKIGVAYCDDIKKVTKDKLKSWKIQPGFDAALTSPPYATALPYIDTQRLSLVWLRLCPPDKLNWLEAELTGSRELYKTEKMDWEKIMNNNDKRLPAFLVSYCKEMSQSVSLGDGFRRQAVPLLLYRYFSHMRDSFQSIASVMKRNSPFALIVGHNQTTLGGRQFSIDTPNILARLSESCGWRIESSMPLETYQRYDVHKTNSIAKESLIILRKI